MTCDERYEGVRTAFYNEFGCLPAFLVRAPGRVNLIGEHIDYSGFGVCPMAIEQDIVMAVGVDTASTANHTITISNLKPKYTSKTVELELGKAAFDPAVFHWTNYVLAGLNDAPPVPHLMVFVDGTIPPGAGVSSSSALVCAATMASLQLHGTLADTSKAAVAEQCIRNEKLVGTDGGGMDQAICILAEQGYAKKVEFSPALATSNVSLPTSVTISVSTGVVWVIANSLVESHKVVTGRENYNKRVVECRLATCLLDALLSPDGPIRPYSKTMWELVQHHSLTMDKALALVQCKVKSTPYTLESVMEATHRTQESLLAGLSSANDVLTHSNSFALQQRAVHVLSEAQRVDAFVSLCSLEEGNRACDLGRLMNQSHVSCDTLYDCSCPQLNELQRLCLKGGALGSRLTGAGWGGCIISLVPESLLSSFLDTLRHEYYDALSVKPKKESTYLFVTRPSQGASLV